MMEKLVAVLDAAARDVTAITVTAVTSNTSNVTGTPEPTTNPQLQLAYNILVPCILGVIMFAMGCDITWQKMRPHVRRPLGPLIGAICQFILQPLVAFGLANALHLPKPQALGAIIVASCPGGAVSNIFTFWTRGDLSLSVCMTTASTVLSLGMMPLNIFIYSRRWTSDHASMPYGSMVLTLFVVLIPVALGMLVKKRWDKPARIFIRVGSVMGIALILVAGILQGQLYPQVFDAGWNLWVGAALFTPVGFTVGFIMSSIVRFPYPMRRTIGIETGIQNVGVALSVIALTAGSGRAISRYSIFPLVFAAFQMVWGFSYIIIYRWHYRIKNWRRKKYQFEEDEKKKGGLSAKEKEAEAGKKEKSTDCMNGDLIPKGEKPAVPSVSAYVPYVAPKSPGIP